MLTDHFYPDPRMVDEIRTAAAGNDNPQEIVQILRCAVPGSPA